MRAHAWAAAAAATLALLVGGACGDTGDDPVVLVEGVTAEVDVIDNEYDPVTLEVAAGTEITFTNRGRNEHDVVVVDDAGSELAVSLDELPPGTSITRRVTRTGSFDYYCSIHGTPTAGMAGTITVTEGDA